MNDVDLDQLSEEDLLLLAELLGDEYPVTAAQQDMLDCASAHPGSVAAGIHLAFRIEGAVSVERLRAAHDALLERHPALRTTFREDAGRWVQAVSADTAFPLTLRTTDEADDDVVRAALSRHQTDSFDLRGGGALARAELLMARRGPHLLVWSFHHAVVDGYSLGLIWDDFAARYNGHVDEPVPTPFGEYAEWQREWLTGPEAEEQQGRVRAKALPASSPCTRRVSDPDIGSLDIVVPPDLHEAITQLGKESATTTHMMLLAVYRHAVAAEGLLDSVAPVWTPLAGRTDPRFSRTVGMFANALPVYGGAHAESTVDAAMSEVREGCILAMECQSVPRRRLDDLPVQALFALQNTASGSGVLAGSTTSLVRPAGVPQVAPILEFYSPADRLFRTALSFGYRGGGLAGVLEYDRAVVPDAVAQAVVARFGELVRRLVNGDVAW
ncbi:condensation domain-containing protein [Streptomyces sp. ID05-26A]|nr:condensation domain-containing protein [Streptomyces sp. ID05-26A]